MVFFGSSGVFQENILESISRMVQKIRHQKF